MRKISFVVDGEVGSEADEGYSEWRGLWWSPDGKQ